MKPQHHDRKPDADGYFRTCCICLSPTIAVTTRNAICEIRDQEHNTAFEQLELFYFSRSPMFCSSCIHPLTTAREIKNRIHDECELTW